MDPVYRYLLTKYGSLFCHIAGNLLYSLQADGQIIFFKPDNSLRVVDTTLDRSRKFEQFAKIR